MNVIEADRLNGVIGREIARKTAAEGVVKSQEFCVEDVRYALHPQDTPLLRTGELLHQLIGKMVMRVEWVQTSGPGETIGRYVVYVAGGVEKKQEEAS